MLSCPKIMWLWKLSGSHNRLPDIDRAQFLHKSIITLQQPLGIHCNSTIVLQAVYFTYKQGRLTNFNSAIIVVH